MREIVVKTKKNKEVVDITDRVQDLVHSQEIKEGACVIFVKHTTACITTADLDPGTDLDFLDAIEKMIPKLNYRHPHDPSHTPDHIASSIIGPSLTVLVRDGELILGTWQRIVLIELDGPRERNLAFSFLNK